MFQLNSRMLHFEKFIYIKLKQSDLRILFEINAFVYFERNVG
jgi:hypothetical protein